LPTRGDNRAHGSFIKKQLTSAYNTSLTQKQVAAIRYKDGICLEFSSAPEHELATKSLENRKNGILLLNVRYDEETKMEKATVYIPNGKEAYFLDKIEEYISTLTKTGNPKNNNLVARIEDVKIAMLEAFWIGERCAIPTSDAVWCEVWLRFDNTEHSDALAESEQKFIDICIENNIETKDQRIVFPEILVKLVYATREQLCILIGESIGVSELRRAQEAISFFDNLPNYEQQQWVDELLTRAVYQNTGVSICLLDTGITAAHKLLTNAVQPNGVQAVDDTWGNGDHHSHGTEMAGIALYRDLKQALESTEAVIIPHKIESVKLLPPRGSNPHNLYGDITARAVSLAEISNPSLNRILCMAISSSEYNTADGSPTSWSAAIDSIASAADEDSEKRLFLISAGNVGFHEVKEIGYPTSNQLHSVESPGQAWNAITVGAYSNVATIADEDFKEFSALAAVGELSPFSSTSSLWGDRSNKWPIKPEILLDGGNMATNGLDFDTCPDLTLLTTSHRPLVKQFSTIWGTSSATAQAAWMAAQLMAAYPNAWPETIRALIVHSASWTDEMKNQFCTDDIKTKGRRHLLRTCGYGVPSLQKAIQCMDNSVNLVIQGELQPFQKKSMKEMHFHKLPWPTEELKLLGAVPVTLKVTLSYFIEPGPGEVGWKNKYRYPSCNLRFAVINANQSIEDFQKRVNVAMRGEDAKDKGDGTSGSERWYLGPENRDVGSIHSDFTENLNAVDLCDCNYIAVFPVIGWWRERAYLGKYDSKIRYSIIISLSTPEVDVDLYTPIITKIDNYIKVEI